LNDSVLVDTGPLVALLDRSDSEHERCKSALANLHLPLTTTWAVITEAAWLLRADGRHIRQLLDLICDGHVQVVHLDRNETTAIKNFIVTYADQSPQLADASLMYLAEALGITTVFTLDRRDFSVYRTSSGNAVQITPA